LKVAYVADVTKLRAGSIVKVQAPLSSSGKPTYPHFFIVLSIPESPKVGDLIRVAGVTSRISPSSAKPDRHVAMRWLNRRGGDPQTGFNVPCYACADFLNRLPIYAGASFALEVAAEDEGRFIRDDKLQTLVAMVNALTRGKRG
jgi:hypothetical protein